MIPVRPFGPVDELNSYFDSPAEPNNVHLEAWFRGQLEPERLRAAIGTVLATTPAARAHRVRLCQGRARRGRHAWVAPAHPDLDPLAVITWPDEAGLDAARSGFLAVAPPIDQSPPFRLLLARGPGRDSLILNANHAALDGRSCLTLLRLIAAAYTGAEPRPAEPIQRDPIQREPIRSEPAQSEPAASRSLPRRAARIAARSTSRRAPGYGFQLLAWPGVPSAPTSAATVNDLLVAALIGTIHWWNPDRQRPVKVSVPIDIRPPGHGDDLGNLTALYTVTGPAGHTGPLAPGPAVDAVAAQTRRVKQHPRAGEVSAGLAAVTALPLPQNAKRRLLRLAVRWLGPLVSATSLLSNLGNVSDPPRFGTLAPERIWFSTTAHMPRGLSVGAITTGGQLQLCFRYRYALLDDEPALAFAAGYARILEQLAASQTRVSQ